MTLYIQQKKSFGAWKWVVNLVIVGILALAGWWVYTWYTTGKEPPILSSVLAATDPGVLEETVTEAEIAAHNVEVLEPRYISIDSLELVKARIFKAQLDDKNLITAQRNIHDVSWYDESDNPGSGGVVILKGHNTGTSTNGAFYGLAGLAVGKKIVVERGDGEKFTYEVKEITTLTLDEFNGSGISKLLEPFDEEKEALNIMTYSGTWIPSLESFDQRVILRAVSVAK